MTGELAFDRAGGDCYGASMDLELILWLFELAEVP